MLRNAASNKRALQEADANVGGAPSAANGEAPSAAKKARAGTAKSAAEAAPAPVPTPTARYIPHGPGGEAMMLRVMPAECADVIDKIPMPRWWVLAIDATLDRSMTLGSRRWWEEYGQWLEANKKALKLKVKDWKRREEALSKPETPQADEGNHDWDFVCVEAPTADEDEEDESDQDSVPGDEAGADQDKRGPVGKLASLHPSHPWSFSLKGSTGGKWWMLESVKHDPDEFSLHIYNDFAVYGGMEVMENLCKPSTDYRDVWCEVEGLALLLCSRTVNFSTCDDPDKLGQLVELMGHMCLVALRFIKEHGALSTTGTIPNFGFVFSMLITYGWELGECTTDHAAHTSWIYALLDMVEEAGIKVYGIPGYESTLESIEGERHDNYTPAAKKRWEKSNFQAKLKWYKVNYSGRMRPHSPADLGGDSYDITKMTAAKRRTYSYGG